MLARLLSNDFPRSRVLAAILVLLFLALAFTPFLIPGVKALNVAAKILVFVVLVASFDLLLGYTGIVSFAHTMFFGIGAYGIAIASSRMGAAWGALLVGLMANYTGFLVPKAALFSNILLMMAILLWRPQGVYALGK
jgi:branched-chain amino acid transport system permease protein